MPAPIPVNPQRVAHITGAKTAQQVKSPHLFGLFSGRKVALAKPSRKMPRPSARPSRPHRSLKNTRVALKPQTNLVNRQKQTGNTNFSNTKPANLKKLEQENRNRPLDLPEVPTHKPGTSPAVSKLTTYRALSERLAETKDLKELIEINNQSTHLAISGTITPQQFSSIKNLTPKALKMLATIPSQNKRMTSTLLKHLVPDGKARLSLIQEIRHQRTIHNISERLKGLRQG